MVVRTESAKTEPSLGDYSQQFAQAREQFVANLKTGASNAMDGLLKGVKSFGEGLGRALQQGVDSTINGVGGVVLATLDSQKTAAEKRDLFVGEAAKAVGQVQQAVGSAVEAGALVAQKAGQSLGEMVENARVDLVQRVQALNDERQQGRVERFVEDRLLAVYERIWESKDGGHISSEVAKSLRESVEGFERTMLGENGDVSRCIRTTRGVGRRDGIVALRDQVTDFSERMNAEIVKAELDKLRGERVEALQAGAPASTDVSGVMKAHGVEEAVSSSDQHQFMICMREVEKDLERRTRVLARFTEIEGSRGAVWTDDQRNKFERVRESFEQDISDKIFSVEEFQAQMASLDRLRTPLHERVLEELEKGAKRVVRKLGDLRMDGASQRVQGALTELEGRVSQDISS